MNSFDDLIRSRPKDEETRLAIELERFSFGVAVSPIAEVTPIEGPDSFVKTVVRLGGIGIDHAQHPESKQQNIILTGDEVHPSIAGVPYIFDSVGMILMAGFGPPLPSGVVSAVANTITRLNDNFDNQS